MTTKDVVNSYLIQHRAPPYFKLSRCAWLVLLSCAVSSPGFARDYFNPAFLENQSGNGATTDLSTFGSDESQNPGRYYVDVYINNAFVEKRNVDFQAGKTADGKRPALQGCFSVAELKKYGVKTDLFPAFNDSPDCADFSVIPAASQHFDFQNQKLRLSIPQAYISNAIRGYIPPEQWDEGINAVVLNYDFNGYKMYGSGSDDDDGDDDEASNFLALQPGLNIGPWRFRNYSTWTTQSSDGDRHQEWNNIYSYLSRDIVALKSQFVAGDSNTNSDVFDSVSFRGLQLSSDDQMLPNSQRGYAPVIRGVARSNAQVVIRQNGRITYQTAVAPGSFEIPDMYPTGSSGDYEVTVKEADGSEQHFVVPYSTLPILQREGRAKYSLTAGKYREGNHTEDNFAQGTLIYGLPYGMTVYGCGQAAGDKYLSLALGFGQNLAMLGAVTVDGTWSQAKFDDGSKESGQSWRVRYSKGVLSTGTNISIAGYRYASEGYNSLQDVMDADDRFYDYYGKRHNRFEVTLNQQLSDTLGSLSLSWVRENYWNSSQKMESLGVGYSNSWKQISYSLSYSYNRNTYQRYGNDDDDSDNYHQNDQMFTFSLNVPFSLFGASTYAHYNVNTSKNGATVNSTSLSGTALKDNSLSWSLQQSHSNQDGDSAGFSTSYQGTYGNTNVGYSWSPDRQMVNYGFSGGLLAHADGVTLSQPITGSAILVKAPGAANVPVLGQTGVSTDFRGYTVIPHVSSYTRNDVSLDSGSFADDVDLAHNSQMAIPTRDAIVRVAFDIRKGFRALLTLTRANGDYVPFGATASVSKQQDESASIVGDKGQLFISGLQENGELWVTWGNSADKACHVAYQLDPSKNNNGIVTGSAICQ
ncbi:fimbria/pilus outer membrane usher protein [Pseudocitrobacter cyperus]|uniref:Fimbria/pilus outer membrane usher protein n=1 Tax=Pseudocitrobacter cyperus TaxID=3112843 RepID=A0ABV0HHQ1_9ENTR